MSGSYTELTSSYVCALVKLSEQRRVLRSGRVCLRLGVIIAEDWRWARWRRWRRGTGSTGGVKERRRSNGALGDEGIQNLDEALCFGFFSSGFLWKRVQ